MRHSLAIICLVLLLGGCASNVPKAPEIVYITVEKYVPVPDELTKPCLIGEPEDQTYQAAKDLALERRQYLIECDGRMTRIRNLGL